LQWCMRWCHLGICSYATEAFEGGTEHAEADWILELQQH
jgi:hypothetical protein